MESIRQYWKRTDKVYLLLCIFSSVMAVTALSSWAAKQGNGFAVDEITGQITGLGDYRRAAVQAGAALIGLVIAVLLALIVFGVFARGIFTSGKTTTEHAQRELHTYAEQHETSLADYPDALVQLYARNPDARDFVRDYPKKKDLTPTIDLSNLSGSKTVPLLLQWDERWGYREYNESIIGLAGCGPTCLSMATIYLTGDTTKDPLWMCRFAEQNQFNVPGSGSKWALISEGGRMLGLDVTQIPLDKDRIYRNLDVGNPIIVVVGPGDFTTDGHFLVLELLEKVFFRVAQLARGLNNK